MLSGPLALAELGRRCNIGFVKDTFFGGAEEKAAKAQQKAAKTAGRLTAAQLAQTEEEFEPFLTQEAGVSLQQQQALAGALGPEEQALAFEQFQEDPGTQFLREQGLRLVDTSAAATGGLGGGQRLRELTKFSQGLALQDLSSRFGRLGATAAGEEAVIARRQQAAGSLGGLRAGLGSQQAQLSLAGGAAQAAGITGQAAGARAGITGAFGLLSSDIRLKENIERIGTLDSGLGWYKWEWTEEGKAIAGDQICYGVIAQEAREVFPDAVVEVDNYLRVDYMRIH